MDGFDLGLGLLFPFFRDHRERDVIMNSVAPVWDGNETWLVLGGGGLMAAFPLAYAVLMPALYTPIIAMLLGLVFRGVAFEFRWRARREGNFWDVAFAAGSLLAALAQGIALGAILQGVTVCRPRLCRRLVGLADAVLDAHRCRARRRLCAARRDLADHEDDRRAARARLRLELAAVVRDAGRACRGQHRDAVPARRLLASLVHLAEPRLYRAGADPGRRWWRSLLLRSLERRQDVRPFVLTLVLFAITYAGLGVSMYPFIVPQSITIWQAAAPAKSQLFMLVGVAILIPMILAYTAFAYWVFRGKVDPQAGYH